MSCYKYYFCPKQPLFTFCADNRSNCTTYDGDVLKLAALVQSNLLTYRNMIITAMPVYMPFLLVY